MVKTLSLLMAALLLIALAVPALAGDMGDVTVNGQVRWRSFIDDTDFNSDTDARHYSEMRTRIGLALQPQDNMSLFFQLQDSRVIGVDAGTSSLGFSNTVNLHQGYMVYKPCDKGALQVGRFEMNMHNQRLVGAVGWSNIGRTFEGLKFDRSFDSFMLSLFATQLSEHLDDYDTASGTDHYFAGFNGHFDSANFDLFVYYDDDEANDDMSRFTFGLYTKRNFNDDVDFEFMGAYQVGTYDAVSVDIAAWMLYTELGYTLDNGFRFGFLADITSGTAADDTDYKTFDNLYYTGHKFRGAMDYFVGQPVFGLMDLAVRMSYPFNDSWSAKADAHLFSNVEDRWATTKTLGETGTLGEKAIGTEVDLALTYKDTGAFSWTNGFSFFTLSDDYAPDTDTSIWFYSMATMNF